MGREMANAMAKPGDMLFGRRTWQDFITARGRLTDGNPVTTHINAATKYVVSRTLEDADAWQNSVLLRDDAVGTVAALKAQSGRDLSVIGSASLVRSLHAAALIDRYTLLICPLTLGSGARLFEGPAPLTDFELTGSVCDRQGRDHRAVRPPVRRGPRRNTCLAPSAHAIRSRGWMPRSGCCRPSARAVCRAAELAGAGHYRLTRASQGVSARQTHRPRHGDYNASVPVEGLDQLSLAQFAQRPAHRAAGDRVLAGKLILGRQGRAKRVRAIGYARGDVVGDLSPDRIIGRPLARHAGNSRSPPSQMTAAPGPARPISDHAQRLALVHVRCTSSRRSAWLSRPVSLPVQAARVWMFGASSGI